jgi:hypothetical protein
MRFGFGAGGPATSLCTTGTAADGTTPGRLTRDRGARRLGWAWSSCWAWVAEMTSAGHYRCSARTGPADNAVLVGTFPDVSRPHAVAAIKEADSGQAASSGGITRSKRGVRRCP